MPLEVIGAGFGRTGTLSLKIALEVLGFAKCYQMSEVFARPDHVDLWMSAWRGEDLWETLFAGYAAAVDWPTVSFLPRLIDRYPSATVILTVRDPHSWYLSARATILRSMACAPRMTDKVVAARVAMIQAIVVEGTFAGDITTERHVCDVYRRHVATVIDSVPAGRLVQFDVRDGWPPLCEGLGLRCRVFPFRM